MNLNLSRISDLSKISAEIWLRLETFCESGPRYTAPLENTLYHVFLQVTEILFYTDDTQIYCHITLDNV